MKFPKIMMKSNINPIKEIPNNPWPRDHSPLTISIIATMVAANIAATPNVAMNMGPKSMAKAKSGNDTKKGMNINDAIFFIGYLLVIKKD